MHAAQELCVLSADERALVLREESVQGANTLRVAMISVSCILRRSDKRDAYGPTDEGQNLIIETGTC